MKTVNDKTELKLVKREQRVLNAGMRALQREYRWFIKQRDQMMKKDAALKARRAELEGKEANPAPSPECRSPQSSTAANTKPERSNRKR